MFGVLGPNGAGETTTVECVRGRAAPMVERSGSSGSIRRPPCAAAAADRLPAAGLRVCQAGYRSPRRSSCSPPSPTIPSTAISSLPAGGWTISAIGLFDSLSGGGDPSQSVGPKKVHSTLSNLPFPGFDELGVARREVVQMGVGQGVDMVGGRTALGAAAASATEGEERPLRPRCAVRALLACAFRTTVLIVRRRVHQPAGNVGRRIRFADGTTAEVYRETVITLRPPGEPAVLVVCFRLRRIRREWAHALFRGESELNTVLFAGFPGLVSKLWLCHDEHGVYRGLLPVGRRRPGGRLRAGAVVGTGGCQRARIGPLRGAARS